MEGTGTRWLVTLFLLTAAQCPARVAAQTERDSEDSRRVLGSSVVTSVSVIMDHGNGTKTYFADGQSKHVHKPTDRAVIGSPGNLLSPDRYEFYTFDETGDLVKRLMTLDEIHGLIAGADPESVMADASPTYYHDALSSHSSEALMHLPATDLESLDAPAVHKVLESVQNVLKNEMAANSGKPAPQSVLGGGGGGMSLHRPDSASAWSALFPGLIETPDDVAHLSGYLLPSKTAAAAESTDRLSSTKRPQTTAYVPPSTSVRPSSSATTNNKLPPSTTKTYYTTSTTSSTTEKVRSTPKYTTVGPEATTKFAQAHVPTTAKPTTSKKPFRPVQSFDKQKPAPQKPTLVSHATARPSAAAADGLDINKEMSASISDMLSQVTDSQSADRHKPLQTNALVEKDNAADYVPEESSPELSYYSPVMAAVSSSAAAGAATTGPVAEALTSVKRPVPSSQTTTVAFKTTGTETPFSQKIASGASATRFGPTKANATRPRPPANATAATATYTAKPAAFNKYNGTATVTASTTRNNYQYPPSNMSTKYMQKITQTTQAYPNKLIDSSVKVVNKTVNNATLSVKQQPSSSSWSETRWNLTEDAKNKFHGGPDKVFQTKVTSVRPPGGINRTNVTLSNRVQEPKTTAAPDSTAGYSTTTGAVRGTAEPDKFVSVKVEEWPTMTVQHRPTAWPTTTPYASTEKSYYSGQPLSAITDPNAIRDLLSSLMVKSTTASSASTGTVSPTTASVGTVQTLTAAVSTTTTTPSTTTTAAANATSESTTTTAAAAATATALSMVKTAIEEATTATTASATTAGTTTAGTTTAGTTTTGSSTAGSTTAGTTTTGSSTAGSTTAGTTTTGSSTAGSTTAGTTTAGTTTTGSTTTGSTTPGSTTTGSTTTGSTTAGTTTAGTTTSSSTTSGTTTSSTTATGTTATGTTSAGTTAASPTTAGSTAAAMASKAPDATWTTTEPSTTPESETQYVPVTHFLPELQVKDRPETDTNNNNNNNNYSNNNSNNNNTGGNVAPGVDAMLKDGISAVANMLQNTQKPAIVGPEYPETGPDEDATMAALTESDDQRQSSTTEQARRQPTIKTDADETTAAAAATQDAYESTAATEPTTRWPDNDNDTDTVAQMSRISEPGLEMLTVFNVSSTGGPVQVAKLADLSAETPSPYDGTTTPFAAATDASQAPAATTEEPAAAATTTTAAVTLTPAASSTTAAASPSATVSAATVASSSATVDSSSATAASSSSSTITAKDAAATPAAPAQNATAAPGVKSPGPSSNAYRPPANGGAASPSTVELHPAPHESMGLEASVAFLGDDVRRFADLCNELSFKMWTAVTGKGQIASRSLVLSPFELTAMLAMVFLGARGSTSGQMNDILRLDDMVTFNPHQVLRNITHSITNGNNPGVATASFVREIYSHKGNGKILDFYKERVQQYYDGHVEEVDFNAISDVLRRRTNLLVKRQTLGRVIEYLRGSGLSLTPPFAAFSANVFQTSCEGASTEGRDGEMYFVVRPSTRQRRLVPVPAAVWRGGFLAGYEPGLDATAVCLSPDSAVSTVLVLPGQQGQVAPGDGLARLEQRLIETSYRRGGWSRVLRSLLPRPGLELQVPRFSHRSVLNATAALQRMGLRDVFNEQRADLRGVNGLYDLHLSDMLQVNTFSTCGEDTIGARHHVETYPASPQRMGRAEETPRRRRRRSGQPDDLPLHSPYSHLPLNLRPRQARLPDVPRLRFDRPFLYLVRHNPTGMIVYLGRFNPRLLP